VALKWIAGINHLFFKGFTFTNWIKQNQGPSRAGLNNKILPVTALFYITENNRFAEGFWSH